MATGNVLLGLVCGINGNDPFAPWGAVVRKGVLTVRSPATKAQLQPSSGPYSLSTSSGIMPYNMLDLVVSKP